MATDLGKVGMVMKGTWNSSATYEALDAVSYNGALYIAKQDVPANTTPTNTTYWQAALEGVKGTHVFNNASPYSLTVEGNTMGLIVIQNAAGGQTPGLYAYMATSGAALVSEIKAPSATSYSVSGRVLTFTAANSASIHSCYIYA